MCHVLSQTMGKKTETGFTSNTVLKLTSLSIIMCITLTRRELNYIKKSSHISMLMSQKKCEHFVTQVGSKVSNDNIIKKNLGKISALWHSPVHIYPVGNLARSPYMSTKWLSLNNSANLSKWKNPHLSW